MKSYMAKKGELAAKWLLIDASDKIVGRLATRIATILMGKHKPEYTPHVDTGDFVVVLNAAKIRHTGGNKMAQRTYDNYSHFPGGLRVWTLAEQMKKDPSEVVVQAVTRMLPKTKLGKAMIKKLKVYNGAEHPHQAQQPESLAI